MKIVDAVEKPCRSCLAVKLLSEFHFNKRFRDGLTRICKTCVNNYARAWHKANPECARKNHKRHYTANREKILERTRKWHKANPEKIKASQKKYANAHPERLRLSYVKYKYGLHPDIYKAMAEAQNSLCAICKEPEQKGKTLGVDHCHTTGRIRGLLCFKCNIMLGMIEGKPSLLTALASTIIGKYLLPLPTSACV